MKTTALFSSILFWLAFMASLVAGGQLASLFPACWSRPLYGIFGTLAAYLLAWLFLRREKGTFQDAGLVWESRTLSRFGAGLVTGAALFSLLLLPLLFFTPLQISRTSWTFDWSYLAACLALVPLALMEEVAFRSLTFLKLNQAFGLRLAQLITALAFGLYHIANGWSPYAAFTGTFIWAFIYGLAAARSGGIALPLGIHFAVNLLQKLAGTGQAAGSPYQIHFPDNTPQALTDRAGYLQLGIMTFLLLMTLLLTERHLKGKRRTASGRHG